MTPPPVINGDCYYIVQHTYNIAFVKIKPLLINSYKKRITSSDIVSF